MAQEVPPPAGHAASGPDGGSSSPGRLGSWAGIPWGLWNKLQPSAIFGLLLLLVVAPVLIKFGVDSTLAVSACVAVFLVHEGRLALDQFLALKKDQMSLDQTSIKRLSKYGPFFGQLGRDLPRQSTGASQRTAAQSGGGSNSSTSSEQDGDK